MALGLACVLACEADDRMTPIYIAGFSPVSVQVKVGETQDVKVSLSEPAADTLYVEVGNSDFAQYAELSHNALKDQSVVLQYLRGVKDAVVKVKGLKAGETKVQFKIRGGVGSANLVVKVTGLVAPDGGPDKGLPDGGPDKGLPDSGKDKGTPDSGKDKGPADSGAPDAAPDAGAADTAAGQ